MTKGKIISIPTTVEAQIRTRARNLPIYKCYVSKDWDKLQMANIMIVRKHTNGNITMGNYLVDLKLRGVKDCTYRFNESPLRMDEMIESCPDLFEECDYHLAHNIIYAGLEFAEDYGFAPHKNFKTAQYILEEDTDDIPLIEIPLGDDGVPVLEIRHGETGQHEMSVLDKTAGDNYRVVYFDKEGNPILPEETYTEIFDQIMETGIDQYIERHSTPNHKESQVLLDLVYMAKSYTDEDRKQIDEEFIHILGDPRLAMDVDLDHDYEEELEQAYDCFKDGETEKAIAESRKLIEKYPEEPLLWDVLLYNLSVVNDNISGETVKEAYSLFPEHPYIKAWYAEWLAQETRAEEIFTLFNQLPGLDALTTENTFITANAFASFCNAYAIAWLSKKDIRRAEPYYQIIARMEFDNRLGEYIQWIMTDMKRKKITEMVDAGMFKDDEKSVSKPNT